MILLGVVGALAVGGEWLGGASGFWFLVLAAYGWLFAGAFFVLLVVLFGVASIFSPAVLSSARGLLPFFLSLVLFPVGLLVIAMALWPVRAATFARVADRAQPLIVAIRAYEDSNGAPPPALDALVPNWIEDLPTPGLFGTPGFVYDPQSEREIWEPPARTLPETWSLRVDCSRGFLNWDVFIFYPDGLYDGVGPRWGGSHEMIRDWAYVHE
ncbi:MAG: hypothetical protein AAF726_09860 [Planctomycetota bacterium]